MKKRDLQKLLYNLIMGHFSTISVELLPDQDALYFRKHFLRSNSQGQYEGFEGFLKFPLYRFDFLRLGSGLFSISVMIFWPKVLFFADSIF